MAWEFDNNTALQNDNEPQWELEGTKPVTQSVMDDRDGQVYNVPLAFDGIDTRFAIDTQHKGADKGSFFGKVDVTTDNPFEAALAQIGENSYEKLVDSIEKVNEKLKTSARTVVGHVGNWVDTAIVDVTRLRDKQYEAEHGYSRYPSFFFGSDETQEEIKASAQEAVANIEKIRKNTSDWFKTKQENIKKEETFDDVDTLVAGVTDAALSVAEAVGATLVTKDPKIAAYYMANLFGSMRKNEVMDTALEKGIDFDKADLISTGAGVIEGGLEIVGGLALAKVAKLKSIVDIKNRVMDLALIKMAKSKLGKQAGNKLISRHMDSVWAQAYKGALVDGVEEGTQTSSGMIYENLTGLANYDSEEIINNTLFSIAVGGITGGAMGGAGTAYNNRLIKQTNDRLKTLLKQDTPELTDQELQVTADAVQEMLFQESANYIGELNNVLSKEANADVSELRQEGLTPEQLTAETRKLLKEKYQMSDEDINKTIQSALSVIDARNQFNEAYTVFNEGLTNAGRGAALADAEARILASRALAVARAEGTQVKDVMDRWSLQFKKTAWNETDIEAQSKPVVEFNAVTFEDTKSQEAVKSAFLSNGFSEKAADDAIANLQKVVDFAKQLGQESDRLREQNERSEYIEQRPTEDVSKYESEGMSLAVDSGKKTLGMVPRVSVFVKNGDYQYNIDFGTTCTRREPLEAAVKIMIDMGKAGNLGLSQINNIKDILGKHGFTKPCVLCFVEGKRTYELISANRLTRQWNVVLKSIGVEDAKVIGTERKLTDEMINRLKEMSQGDGYEKYVDKKYRDKNEKDPVGLTQARAKAISKIMLDEYERTGKSTLVNRMRPDMLMNSRGTDYLFRKYITDAPTLKGLIAARDGAGTPKPHTSYPVYDTRSWKEIFDLKKDVKKEVKHLFDIGGVRLQSFSDFNEYMVIDYLQAMLDMAARRLPAHSYTKVTSFVELFGEMLNINMSLIGEPAKGVPAEYDGLRPAKEGDKVVLEDENGKWTYNWATESFDPEKAFQLRKEERFNGKVGTVGIGISDKQILAMLNDPEIDMIIPFHKSGIQDHVLISAGLKRADGTEVKDYSDFQNTKKPKGFKEDYLFNEHMQKIGDAKDVAADYLSWCKTKKCKPKFEQFSKHENYYKLLEDFRSYDNNGKPVVQKAVEFKTGENFNEMLANAIKDRDDVVGAISKIQNNEALMRDLEEAVRYYHLDGELKKVMLNKIEKALGGKEHLKILSQEDMLEELSKTNPKETQEFRDGKGVLYGFAKGGQIFLNVQGFNANTPVHEYSHIWARVVQSTNKKLWEKGVSLLEQTDKWKELEGKEQYKELRKNKDMFASEVFAHIVGENNEEIARYFQDPDAPEYKNKSLKSKILQFIKDVFGYIRSMFDPKFKLTDVKDAKDFATMALLDLYDDGRAAELAKTVKAMRKNGEFLQESQGDFLFQSAFHGSPHSELEGGNFKLEKIGTGENAQAHGYGLYYTASYEVADEKYRKRLLRPYTEFISFGEIKYNKETEKYENAFNYKSLEFEVYRDFKLDANEDFDVLIKSYEQMKGIVEGIEDRIKIANKYKDYLIKGDVHNFVNDSIAKGQVYEVDLPENPYLLDEQKTYEEQSDFVKSVLDKIGDDFGIKVKGQIQAGVNFHDITGRYIYSQLSGKLGSAKAASQKLNEYGIKGITYEGRQDGRCFVIFNPDDVKVIQKFYQEGANNPRGAYQNSIIYLFENADASTVIHELGHFFLDDMQKFADNKTTKEQLEAIYKFVGSTDGNLTPEQHEYFANAFELYLMEGRAPNKTLESVFTRFKNWLGRMLNEVKRLSGVKVNPDIRKVFDQMLGGRGLDFSMQMSGARITEALERGTISQWQINRALEAVRTGRASKSDMQRLIQELRNGMKADEFAAKVKELEAKPANTNMEQLSDWDYNMMRNQLESLSFHKDKVKARIERLLKWSEPRSQNGRLVGRFPSKEMNDAFDHYRALARMDRAEAKEKRKNNIELIEEQMMQGGENNIEELKFDNRLLSFAIGDIKGSEMVKLYDALSESYNIGRLSSNVTGEVKRKRRERLIQNAKNVLTDNGRVNHRIEDGKIKQFIKHHLARWGVSQQAWSGILDTLSMNDKSSKTGQSMLSKDLDIFEAEQKKHEGIAMDSDNISSKLEKALAGSANAAQSVNRYMNNELDKESRIEWMGVKDPKDKNSSPVLFSKKFTKDKLIDIWMKAQDPETLEIMMNDPINQYNKEFLQKVEDELTEDDLAVARALFAFYDENYVKFNAFYEDHFGVSLPKSKFYSPRSMVVDGVDIDDGSKRGYVGFSGSKERTAKPGSAVVNIKGAFRVLNEYINKQNHYMAYADKMIDINSVLTDKAVKNIIGSLFGQEMNAIIKKNIENLANNGNDKIDVWGKFWNRARARFAKSVLAVKPALAVKQLTSFPAYWENVSNKDFVLGVLDFFAHPKEAIETLGNTTLMKTRDINIIRDFEQISKSDLFKKIKKIPGKIRWNDFAMWNIKFGDRGAIYVGGWALYKSELKKNLARGMDAEKAKALALETFERVTDETQQSGRISQQSSMQQNSFTRVFTMFQSSQNQYLRKEINAIRGLVTGRADKKQAAKTLFIFHVLLPCFFQVVSDFGKFDKDSLLRAAVLGSLNGWFILNKVLESVWDLVFGDKQWGNNRLMVRSFVPEVGSFEDMISAVMEITEDDIELEDVLDIIKPVGELTGLPLKYALDIYKNTGEYLENEEYGKAAGLWLGWSSYALRDIEED